MSKGILKRVADDSSSLVATTCCKESRLMENDDVPDNSLIDDTEFEFDHEVINTQAYRRAFMIAQ